MKSVRDIRKGQNEAWFRELNERLADRAAEQTTLRNGFEVVCECSQEECTERITISIASYEAVRADAKTFLVVPSHSDPSCERVVASMDDYDVVEKFGAAGLVAEIEDPRNEDASIPKPAGIEEP